MFRVARLLTALLAFTLLAANSASAITTASAEKPASGLFGALEQHVGIDALASAGRIDEKLSLLYDFASDFPVAARGGLVIGRGSELAKPGALRTGEYSLEWETKLPNYKAEWAENAGRLREAVRYGKPIRDISPGDTGGLFLSAERALLKDRGWTFNSQTGYWMPPGG